MIIAESEVIAERFVFELECLIDFKWIGLVNVFVVDNFMDELVNLLSTNLS
jgi:hypothetical protein